MVHSGTHVDLDNPRVQVLIYHEIIANHLKKPFFSSNTSLASFDTPDNDIFDFFLNIFPIFSSYKLTESFHVPHGIIDGGIFMMFLNGVVG